MAEDDSRDIFEKALDNSPLTVAGGVLGWGLGRRLTKKLRKRIVREKRDISSGQIRDSLGFSPLTDTRPATGSREAQAAARKQAVNGQIKRARAIHIGGGVAGAAGGAAVGENYKRRKK